MLHSVVIAENGFKGNTAPLVGDYQTLLPLAKHIGFDAVQLAVNNPLRQPVRLLQNLILKEDIKVSSIATGMGFSVDGLSITSADLGIRMEAVKRMIDHVKFSAEIGRPKVVIGAIRGVATDNMTELEYVENLRDSCNRILEIAVKNNIVVLLEATDHLETNMMLSVEETLRFIKSFDTANFKIQLDTMHMYNENEDMSEAINKSGSIIGQVDISGVGRNVPDNKRGIIFNNVIDALKKVNYSDYLVYEFINDDQGKNAKTGLEFIKSMRE